MVLGLYFSCDSWLELRSRGACGQGHLLSGWPQSLLASSYLSLGQLHSFVTCLPPDSGSMPDKEGASLFSHCFQV